MFDLGLCANAKFKIEHSTFNVQRSTEDEDARPQAYAVERRDAGAAAAAAAAARAGAAPVPAAAPASAPPRRTRRTSCTLVSPVSTRDSASSCRYLPRFLRKAALKRLPILPPPAKSRLSASRASSSITITSYTPTRPLNRRSLQNVQGIGLFFSS